jgi:hypothetical protein
MEAGKNIGSGRERERERIRTREREKNIRGQVRERRVD